MKGLDTALNSAMRTVSGCLRPTPVNQLPILSGIAPPALRREAAALVLSRKAKTREDHLLHRIATEKPPRARLKSRRPFSEHAHHLLHQIPDDVSKQSWLRTRCMGGGMACCKPYQTAQIHQHPRPSPGPRSAAQTMDDTQPPQNGCREIWGFNEKVGP